MKKVIPIISFLLFFSALVHAEEDNTKRIVLIKEKLLSGSQYMIIARGYPKPGLTESLQIKGTSKEAALLNAQIIARQRFNESLDIIKYGAAKKYSFGNGYADVTYIISYPKINSYLKKKR